MKATHCNVAVLGSGFGGSLTALGLNRVGLRTVVVDRSRHPRFAIGESSTPIADLVLRDLAVKYDLPKLLPLASFGTWQASYPQIGCGRKRGFSYFEQKPNQSFTPYGDHRNELLVAASGDDFHSDTHWLRADVDTLFIEQVRAAGIQVYEQAETQLVPNDQGWSIRGHGMDEALSIQADFVVDATGQNGAVPRALGIADRGTSLRTNSRAIYSHFEQLEPWHHCLATCGAGLDDHPFCCDHAALHQVLDEGWMWQLRFENGITSAGFVLDAQRHPLVPAQSIQHEWIDLLTRYPSLSDQFAKARIVDPPGQLLRSGRLQRCVEQAAGATWALLPNTAGFVDPLHSTGIAQTLCAIERLVPILRDHWRSPSLASELAKYQQTLLSEIEWIDQLVHGCYLARRNFRLFAACSMLYFAAATTYERRRMSHPLHPSAAFLCADDQQLRRVVGDVLDHLHQLLPGNSVDDRSVTGFEKLVAERIAPYNHVGLCDASAQNMYRYTAAR